MIKNVIKRKIFSCFLASAVAVSVIGVVPPTEINAGEEVYAQRSFDSSYDTENAYSGDDLGCTYTPEKTTFKVWSPEASSVVLCRYEEGSGGSAVSETPMTKGDKGVWSTEVAGDIVNTYYTYKVTVNGTAQEAVDPYAKAAGINGDRAMVVDLDSTDPKHWDKNYKREETLLSDIIVWEVHIRDFSIDVSSGVSEENRGKYKAFTEKTTVGGEGRAASCVDYLKELGVTHVQLLPMYDFASIDEANAGAGSESNYSWGYDPKNYNVPEGSYSSDPYNGNVRITEMKEMIQALHDAGIKVIMDVAYSHTVDAKDSNFNKIMPDYYYKVNSDLSYNDQSGYGNATRSESTMFRKFMIDSVSYWAEEYNLDGFRFDLMGIHDVTTMNQIRKALDGKFGKNTIVLYGEGRTGDDIYGSTSAHKANETKLDYGIGYYNEQIKEALKGGDTYDGTIGLVQTNYFDGEYLEPNVKWPNNVFGGIMGSVGYTSGEWGMWRPFWSKSSNCCLSYVSSHDNLTLWDKLTEGLGKDFSSVDNQMIKMNKLAGSVVLVSKGGVLMQAGEEFARTKNGESNSCASPDSVNKIDWNRVSTYSDIQKYYQGMIRIRKAFSGFRSVLKRSADNWNPENNNIEWISKEESGMTAFYETNDVPGEWNRIAVLMNNGVSDETVSLTGSDNWVIVADGTRAGLEKISESGADIVVPGKSLMVAVPKDTFDKNHIAQNEPPVITCDTSFCVRAGERLSFTVQTSDPDGDAVTLNAEGIPEGASFDGATGTFTWEDPAAGEYTVTLTASDGRTTAAKTVTITVTEKTSELKEQIRQAEEKNYQEKDFTEEVWRAFEEALTNARETVDKKETDDAKIQAALQSLKEARENIDNEAAAKNGFADALKKAEARLAEAEQDSANYEAEASADLKTVISEAEELMKSVHSAEEYQSKEEDLVYAVKACTKQGEAGGSVPEPDKTALQEQIARAKNVIQENPDNKNLAELQKSYDDADMVYHNPDASQVTVNQSVRALKKAITAVLEESGKEPDDPGKEPDEPGKEPDEPGKAPDEPGKKPDEPGEEPPQDEPLQPEKELKITNLTIDKVSGTAQAGDNIFISVRATGGSGAIQYCFSVKSGSSTVIQNYSASGSAAWKPKKAGKYSVTVYAKDGKGTIAEKTVSGYAVNEKLKVSRFKASPSSKKARAGRKVKLTIKASGGTKKYQYQFAYKKYGTKKIKRIRKYSSKKAVNWRPKAPGKYILYGYVRDKNTKRIVKKTIRKYTVKKGK